MVRTGAPSTALIFHRKKAWIPAFAGMTNGHIGGVNIKGRWYYARRAAFSRGRSTWRHHASGDVS
jgi:hypothetical protein